MDFYTLAWLLIAAGIFAGGLGLVALAWAVRDHADALRTRTHDHEEW